MLTHYTRFEALENILREGFAWFRNRRRLAHLLIPYHDYSEREPQHFGMVSFTELAPAHAKVHSERFGNVGIVVSDAWATAHNAQRVIYVDESGPVTDALRSMFDLGYRDARSRIKYPDDLFWLAAFENKAAAGAVAGSTLWANLLQLWEYIEPSTEADQREWRIVNPPPDYSLSESKAETVRHVSPAQGWAKITRVLPFGRADVQGFVCERQDMAKLESLVPATYRDMPIFELGQRVSHTESGSS